MGLHCPAARCMVAAHHGRLDCSSQLTALQSRHTKSINVAHGLTEVFLVLRVSAEVRSGL